MRDIEKEIIQKKFDLAMKTLMEIAAVKNPREDHNPYKEMAREAVFAIECVE